MLKHENLFLQLLTRNQSFCLIDVFLVVTKETFRIIYFLCITALYFKLPETLNFCGLKKPAINISIKGITTLLR
jgi:hypothetical protein